jgi:cyanoexosortase A
MHMVNSKMQILARDKVFSWFAHFPPARSVGRKQAWLALCCLQALLSISVVHATQDNATLTLLALIVWWGASLSIEDIVHQLDGRPRPVEILVGTFILVFCCWRIYATFHMDTMVYALCTFQAVGLALVGWPLKRYWKQAIQPIFILSLFGWQLLVQRAIPMAPMTRITAKAVELLLSLFDYQVITQGNTIYHQTGSLVVIDGCSGLDLAIQLSVTAIIFVLVFPLKSRLRRLLAIVLAPVIALVVNCVRVALLTCIHASDMPGRDTLFELLHEHWGGLLFAGIAVALFGTLYLHWVEQQIMMSTVISKPTEQ